MISELDRVRRVVEGWEGRPNQHPDEAKDFIESAVRSFFAAGTPGVLTTTSGYRDSTTRETREQLDIVVVRHDSLSDSDTVDATCILRSSQLHAHLEVAYAGSTRTWPSLKTKLAEDLEKLEKSISADPPTPWKPWLGLVLVGAGWEPHAWETIEFLHERYHAGIERLTVEGERLWPIADVVALPRLLLKKHEYYSGADRLEPAFPAWAAFPHPSDDPVANWRALAIARRFARYSFDRYVTKVLPKESPAMADEEIAAISGPLPQGGDRIREPEGTPFLCISPSDELPDEVVQYVGDENQPRLRRLDKPICSRGRAYLLDAVPVTAETLAKTHRQLFGEELE